jgi:type II secretory pathway pseudopilin PulG
MLRLVVVLAILALAASFRAPRFARAARSNVDLCMSAAHTEKLTVQPITDISGEFTLPGSKSLSNRALLW